jgi:hypothetical protein
MFYLILYTYDIRHDASQGRALLGLGKPEDAQRVRIICIGVVSVVSQYNCVYYCNTCYIRYTYLGRAKSKWCVVYIVVYIH